MQKTVRFLGTRGVPAAHGGFETAAEHVGLELVRRGWRVIVYCQEARSSGGIRYDNWNGIERVLVPERFDGPAGTIWFDALCVRHAMKFRDPCVTFGYNTAFLTAALRARGIHTVINMDGIEWMRARWSPNQRRFLRSQEKLASKIGHHLIADHPEIKRHLRQIAPTATISTIAYGAPSVTEADPALLRELGVEPGRYVTVIARPVPENSIAEMVATFSRKPRGVKMLVLGNYHGSTDPYAAEVLGVAGEEVIFPGAIYDETVLASIRLHSLAYLHGHTVGGTNPSLVEALGCGNAVLAHDNPFNRWVAQDAGLYFSDSDGFEVLLEKLIDQPELVEDLGIEARTRHQEAFRWETITDRYENVIQGTLASIDEDGVTAGPAWENPALTSEKEYVGTSA